MHGRKIGLILLLSACHQSAPNGAAQPASTTIDKTWQLESSGLAVNDTSVTFAASRGRTITLRHAAPDDALFLTLRFPPVGDTARVRDSIHVSVRPVPGKYAFALATTDKLPTGAMATFSYAIHFRTPAAAAARYPSPGRFEQLVAPVQITPDNRAHFIKAERPAADMLAFLLAGAGNYALVVAQ
ncbi:MAG: hypothetical protein ABUL71_05530 [Gemmatimonadota bacterium]